MAYCRTSTYRPLFISRWRMGPSYCMPVWIMTRVIGFGLGFDAVQAQFVEAEGDHRPQRLRHQALVPEIPVQAVAHFGAFVVDIHPHEADGADHAARGLQGDGEGAGQAPAVLPDSGLQKLPGIPQGFVRVPQHVAADLRIPGVGVQIRGILHAQRAQDQPVGFDGGQMGKNAFKKMHVFFPFKCGRCCPRNTGPAPSGCP